MCDFEAWFGTQLLDPRTIYVVHANAALRGHHTTNKSFVAFRMSFLVPRESTSSVLVVFWDHLSPAARLVSSKFVDHAPAPYVAG